jgi:hypothetical protein
MENARTMNHNFEKMAWGAFFIWWGIIELFKFLPKGTWAVGIGLILLGLNAARAVTGKPTSNFTIALGILAIVLGGLDLAGIILSLPFELPVFATCLVVLGGIMLVRALAGAR